MKNTVGLMKGFVLIATISTIFVTNGVAAKSDILNVTRISKVEIVEGITNQKSDVDTELRITFKNEFNPYCSKSKVFLLAKLEKDPTSTTQGIISINLMEKYLGSTGKPCIELSYNSKEKRFPIIVSEESSKKGLPELIQEQLGISIPDLFTNYEIIFPTIKRSL